MKPIGILGGTFDPIHFGHLRTALEIYHLLDLQEVRFIPCQQPVHKKHAQATLSQRMKMLRLALANQTAFTLDTREVERSTPSYTLETVQSLRQDFPHHPLYLLLGNDAFAEFTTWHRWNEILDIVHLILIPRHDHNLVKDGASAKLLQERQVTQLNPEVYGKIWLAPITPLAISSTQIRHACTTGLSPRYLLPESVYSYIRQQHIYS